MAEGGFYISLNSYVVKMLIDMMTVNVHLSFSNLIAPIGLFIFAQAYIDIIWRVSNFAEWKSEPYVRKAVLTKAFAYVQQHSYSYFQNNHIGGREMLMMRATRSNAACAQEQQYLRSRKFVSTAAL